jgi:alpha-galactosidase
MRLRTAFFLSLVLITNVFVRCINQSSETGEGNKLRSEGVAQRPPMGWNSYNAFGATVRESEVKENADFIADKLMNAGWEYVVVDFCWFYPHHPKSIQDNPPQFRLPRDSSYVPWLAMDSYGRLLPDPGKFPSAAGGKGFRPLADYVHARGLKFGIHVMRGIPRQAVWEKSPVKGMEGIDASMVADTTSTCVWLNNMYGLDMSRKGAQEYLNSLFELYAEWGVDFVKVDDILAPYYASEIEGFRKAIDQCGRPMVFSTSLNATPDKADHISRFANMWRISADFWDNWKQLYEMFEYAEEWTPHRKTGAWPDCDMLLLGRLSRRGPVGNERETNFTPEEQRTHVTLWAIAKSPLMFGGDLRVSSPATISLISNMEVISVNQEATEAHQLYRCDSVVVWTSKMQNGDINLALFNLSSSPRIVNVAFSELGVKGKLAVRDLWQQKDLGKFTSAYSHDVPSHGAALVRCSE